MKLVRRRLIFLLNLFFTVSFALQSIFQKSDKINWKEKVSRYGLLNKWKKIKLFNLILLCSKLHIYGIRKLIINNFLLIFFWRIYENFMECQYKKYWNYYNYYLVFDVVWSHQNDQNFPNLLGNLTKAIFIKFSNFFPNTAKFQHTRNFLDFGVLVFWISTFKEYWDFGVKKYPYLTIYLN